MLIFEYNLRYQLYLKTSYYGDNFRQVLNCMYNKFSRVVTKDDSQPAAQAMLHAIGLKDEDFDKPFIGIASTGYEGNPCNMHLNDLSIKIKDSITASDYVGLIFNTIGVSDGISMGTFGIKKFMHFNVFISFRLI